MVEQTVLDVSRYLSVQREVEAVQVTFENLADVAAWCNGELIKNPAVDEFGPYLGLFIKTRRAGDMLVRPGDFVVKNLVGEFYPLPDEKFPKRFYPKE